jgi:hypothetical protein
MPWAVNFTRLLPSHIQRQLTNGPMRRLNLHASALNGAEFDLYTSSLDGLAESHATNDDEMNRSYNDAYFDRLSVGVREARAWFRGRYAGVSVADIDSVCLPVLGPYHGAN